MDQALQYLTKIQKDQLVQYYESVSPVAFKMYYFFEYLEEVRNDSHFFGFGIAEKELATSLDLPFTKESEKKNTRELLHIAVEELRKIIKLTDKKIGAWVEVALSDIRLSQDSYESEVYYNVLRQSNEHILKKSK